MSEPNGLKAPRRRAGNTSEPEGRGVAWPEERGTSDEGRRRLKAPLRRAGGTVISAQAVPASGARTGRAGDFGGFGTRWALLISVAGGLATFVSFPPLDVWPLAVL